MPELNSVTALENLRQAIRSTRDGNRPCVTICSGTGCLAYRSEDVVSAFDAEIKRHGLAEMVDLRRTGCYGFCERGPIVVIHPEEICYMQTRVEDVADIVETTLVKKNIVKRLLYRDFDTGERIAHFGDIPFYRHQKRLLLESNANVDPADIEDYLAIGGYGALAKVLSGMTPEDVVNTVMDSGLRGRGGGGFPTGRKWETTRRVPGDTKYVIVNADEGDPGAYMDRSILEGNPHSVIEGLAIGAYAMGANIGYVYVRQEYPLAVRNTELAIEKGLEYGLLGEDILGSGFDFRVRIHRGAGAFVSGESSALVNSIEGQVGEPRPKYIHTSEKGLWNSPTCLNNVETWANIPHIINHGVDWFRSMGTETSKGTKIFSLVGCVNNTGLVEVPMGITLRDIIYKIGGGIRGRRKFKAVQTGGPSGGVIPEDMLDLPVDFEEITKAGSMMGSGGMIVMDEYTCMVDTARYYVEFLAHESCGKCVPCREGLRQMLNILNRIVSGNGRGGDIDLLEELSEFMEDASLCALGRTAAYPVMSTIKHFRHEYEAHIREQSCPAGVCKALISYMVDQDVCVGCGTCEEQCPVSAIARTDNDTFAIDEAKCVKCGICASVCPDKVKAIRKTGRTAAVQVV